MTPSAAPFRRWPHRTRVARVALAAVIGWHLLAIAAAPYPGSRLKAAVHPWFAPYLRALYLEHDWRFFAPEPAAGRLLRARITDRSGIVHEVRLTEAERRGSPLFFRRLRLWDAAGPARPETNRSLALHLCRRYAAIGPRSVQLVRLHQLVVDDEQYRAGLRPLDPLALGPEPFEPVACPNVPQGGGRR